MRIPASVLWCLPLLWSCVGQERSASPRADLTQVAFLLVDGVYNSELAAPFDVFHHTVFHTESGMQVFTVGRTRDPVRSFEGLRIVPDYDLASAPPFDVLVVPSAEHSMDSDLHDEHLIAWLRERGRRARYLVSVCDGAFLLAEAGLLDGFQCTTFPGDIPAFRVRYPQLQVVEDVSFVVDRHVITGAGGAASYDPAMYLVETMYGKRVAEGIGKGLVIDWRLDSVPHAVAEGPAAATARPACYLPGDQLSPDISVEDASGAERRLGDIVAAAKPAAVLLYVMGGASGAPNPGLAGMWCEDSFNDLALMRRLVRDFEERGVLFIPVLCPPVYHEERFGYADGAFLATGAADASYVDSRRQFVDATVCLQDSGLLPFSTLWFDPRFRLLANPERSVASAPAPEWQGRLKWYRDPQDYGTPTLWVLRSDLTVYGAPFARNNYEAKGGELRYTERDVAARVTRLLRESE